MSFMKEMPATGGRIAPGPDVVLHIEDDSGDKRLLREIVADPSWPDPARRPSRLLQASYLKEAYRILAEERVDAIILDLGLGDSAGLDTCAKLLQDFPLVPIIVLTGNCDPRAGIEAVRLGAQDFLVKDEVSVISLWRALNYGVERQLIRDALARALTEKEAAQRAAEREKQAAQRANRVKSDFLAMMSHEFRTPFNGIIGLAAALREAGPDAEVRSMAASIQDSGERVLSMLSDILDLLELETGTLALDRGAFDPRALVAETAASWTEEARGKELDIRIVTGGQHVPTLMGDRGRIGQVLSHLVGNAVKFTETGFVEIRFEVCQPDAPTTSLRIDVLDSGAGLPDALWSRMSDRFERADLSMVRRHGGLGLGLALAKELVILMGGRLHLGNAPGGGAHVWFSVPVGSNRRVSPDTQFPAPGSIPQPLPGPSTIEIVRRTDQASHRILVVEDTPINRQVFDAILKQTTYTYDFAEDGWSAVEMADLCGYDVILMDIQMPGLDGVETARRIRATSAMNTRTPIIAVTAHGVAGDRARYLSAGMNDYVPKPVTPDSLLSAIERHLEV